MYKYKQFDFYKYVPINKSEKADKKTLFGILDTFLNMIESEYRLVEIDVTEDIKGKLGCTLIIKTKLHFFYVDIFLWRLSICKAPIGEGIDDYLMETNLSNAVEYFKYYNESLAN